MTAPIGRARAGLPLGPAAGGPLSPPGPPPRPLPLVEEPGQHSHRGALLRLDAPGLLPPDGGEGGGRGRASAGGGPAGGGLRTIQRHRWGGGRIFLLIRCNAMQCEAMRCDAIEGWRQWRHVPGWYVVPTIPAPAPAPGLSKPGQRAAAPTSRSLTGLGQVGFSGFYTRTKVEHLLSRVCIVASTTRLEYAYCTYSLLEYYYA